MKNLMLEPPHPTQNGNVFLYVLIAIALFAGLTLVLSRGQDGGGENKRLAQGHLAANAQRILAYVNGASQAWLRLSDTGTDLDDISLLLPTDGAFNTAPTIHKFFHPDGGGFLYRDMNEAPFRANSTAPVGWHFVLVNADWSPSAGTDLVMTYLNLSNDLCAEINRQVRNDATIPVVTVNYTDTFVNGSAPLIEAECAECKNFATLCVQNTGVNALYNMIQMR